MPVLIIHPQWPCLVLAISYFEPRDCDCTVFSLSKAERPSRPIQSPAWKHGLMSALLSRQRARRTLGEATDPAILSLLFVLLQRLSAAHRLYLPPNSEPYHVDPKPLLPAPQPYSGNSYKCLTKGTIYLASYRECLSQCVVPQWSGRKINVEGTELTGQLLRGRLRRLASGNSRAPHLTSRAGYCDLVSQCCWWK